MHHSLQIQSGTITITITNNSKLLNSHYPNSQAVVLVNWATLLLRMGMKKRKLLYIRKHEKICYLFKNGFYVKVNYKCFFAFFFKCTFQKSVRVA